MAKNNRFPPPKAAIPTPAKPPEGVRTAPPPEKPAERGPAVPAGQGTDAPEPLATPVPAPVSGPPEAGPGEGVENNDIPEALVGDIVHYVAPGGTLDFDKGANRAALVLAVDPTGLQLKVFPSNGRHEYRTAQVQFSPLALPNTWHPKDFKHD